MFFSLYHGLPAHECTTKMAVSQNKPKQAQNIQTCIFESMVFIGFSAFVLCRGFLVPQSVLPYHRPLSYQGYIVTD